MKLIDTEETIVIVTGTSPTAEERDRPLAYQLKAMIDQRGEGHAYRRAVVVGDDWYLENETFHHHPTVAIGGPGANGVTQEFAEALPTVYGRDNEVFVQADFDEEVKRAALWGANSGCTAAAVAAFVAEGFLDELLERIWRFRVGTYV